MTIINGLETEPNGGITNADTLTSGSSVTGQLSTKSDNDYFSITTSASGIISVSFDNPEYSDNNYFKVSLIDKNANVISSEYSGKDISLSAAIEDAGTYYIKVEDSYNFSGKDYGLTVLTSSTATAAANNPAAYLFCFDDFGSASLDYENVVFYDYQADWEAGWDSYQIDSFESDELSQIPYFKGFGLESIADDFDGIYYTFDDENNEEEEDNDIQSASTEYNDDGRYYFEDAKSQYPNMSAEYEKAELAPEDTLVRLLGTLLTHFTSYHWVQLSH